MKQIKNILLSIAVMAAIAVTFSAIGAPDPPSADIAHASIEVTAVVDPSADAVATPVDGLITGIFGKYSSIAATVFMIVGILRACIKPIMTIAEVVVKATPSTKDEEALERFEQGPIMKWTLYVLDWLFSLKKPGASTNPLTK